MKITHHLLARQMSSILGPNHLRTFNDNRHLLANGIVRGDTQTSIMTVFLFLEIDDVFKQDPPHHEICFINSQGNPAARGFESNELIVSIFILQLYLIFRTAIAW